MSDCGHLWGGDGGVNGLACLLPAGHDGPHHAPWADEWWTDDSEIVTDQQRTLHVLTDELGTRAIAYTVADPDADGVIVVCETATAKPYRVLPNGALLGHPDDEERE